MSGAAQERTSETPEGLTSSVPASTGDLTDDAPWDLVIDARPSFPAVEIREIWRYRDLLLLFVHRDIVSFYKQTILGPLWFLIQPIFTMLIYVLVFGQIAGLSTEGAPQVLFYLCGITFWNYFSECFNKTATVFRDNANLFGKVYFPRILVPLSIVISNLLRFVIQFGLFLCFWAWYAADGQVHATWAVLSIPVLLLLMASLGLGLGMLFSAMTTKYRDLVFLLQFGVQLLMYATPVIYPMSQIPSRFAKMLAWNPLAPIFEIARHAFLGVGQFDAWMLGYSVLFSVVLLVVSAFIFHRVERTFMDTV
ncbi:Teichoic acid translocation permease protein TagG [Planctomycetes bacterium CA13]|uniref:Transport permease protein n=1 Tax=Novipirellula herctigrandis TaxID=2527986 RepID=A0A5C5Z3U6_9BACT|nr:Teichoic acid translocation permease protein TagG [Planctomycetes bacterium CA13]